MEQSQVEPQSTAQEVSPSLLDATPTPSYLSGLSRALFLFTGVILPIICFSIQYPEQPRWQSGNIVDYAQLFLSHEGSLPFYPLLLYNIISMTLMIYDPNRFIQHVIVRWGIYSGVAVALGFWGLLIIAFSTLAALIFEIHHFAAIIILQIVISPLAVFIPWGIVLFLGLFLWKKSKVLSIIILPLMIALAGIGYPIVLLFCLWSSTSWAVAAYTAMSVWIVRHRGEKRFQLSLSQLLGITAWWASYFSAWRIAYLIVLEKYAQLPTKSTGPCYVCTAAAR